MAPTAALASTATAAMERAAQKKKPWRYYYVMAFPLSNAPSNEKLAGMLEMTDTIERREETYLQSMLDRDAPPERRDRAMPLARYTATVLAWLSGFMAVVALASVVCVYRMQVTSMTDELDPRVLTAAFAIAISVVALNAALIAALRLKSTLLLRGCVLLLSLSIGGAVFLLDEMDAVRFSQQQLADAIEQPRSAFQATQMDLVLNGGEAPSLWHRFFFDGPSWFLLWLEQRCVKTSITDTAKSDDGSTVDSSDFFTPLWKPPAQQCTRNCLTTHIQMETVLRGVLTSVVAVMTTQLLLAALLVWIDEQVDDADAKTETETDVHDQNGRTAISRKRRRRRRQQLTKRGRADAKDSGTTVAEWPVSFVGLVRLGSIGLGLSGGAMAIVSLTVLTSCSFVGPTESWTLVVVAVVGGLQILVGLCTFFAWRQQLVKSLLVGGLALESYVASDLTEFCAALSTVRSSSSRDSTPPTLLRDAYDVVFQQTCQPMRHWRLHVCVAASDSVSRTPHSVTHVGLSDSPACQDQLAALLRTTAQQSLVLLSWMMATQTVVLVWLLLPSVRALLDTMWMFLRGRLTGEATDTSTKDLQQSRLELSAAAAKAKRYKHATLPLADARQLYLATMKRSDALTLQAEAAAFDAEWTKMSSSPSTAMASVTADTSMVFTHQFEAILRTLVLRRLTVQCKLDVSLSVSRDGKQLLARLAASDNLLMTTLCQCGPTYKLQFADAIDPGDAFWHDPRERKSDAKLLDAHTVHQKFKLLQLHGVVTRHEAEIFPTESLTRVSSRVHALLRIHRWQRGTLVANAAAVTPYAPFVEYAPQRQLQYLYKRYPNRLDTAATAQQRRAAVLRTIDCLRLTRQLLDAEFDLDLMRRHRLLDAFTELHSASRFDVTSRASLLASWVAFWRAPAPHTHWLGSSLTRISPFRQPLRAVRDYFGECIAFYFAWLACYTQWLLLPTLASVVLLATHVLDTSLLHALAAFCGGDETTDADDFTLSPSAVSFGLAVVAWAAAFAKAWERRSVWLRLEWGMDSDEHDNDDNDDNDDTVVAVDRANFRGVRRRNPVTQQIEVHFPSRVRTLRQLLSMTLVVCAGVAHLTVCALLLLVQGVVSQWLGVRLAVTLSCLAVALLMLANGDGISALAHRLSEWENYQSERAFQRGVIFKVCALQLFNTYGLLLLVAFALYHTDGSSSSSDGSTGGGLPVPSALLRDWAAAFHARIAPHVGVVVQLQLLLALVFATRIASHVLLMTHGLLREALRRAAPTSTSAGTAPLPPSVESELALQPYRGCYEDYTEIVVQLGLVAMFSGVFPLAPALAFVECALEMRFDALDLCLFLQRPTPEPASGIGPWATCVRTVLRFAVVVELALLYFVADNYAPWSAVRRVGAFLASVLVAWVAAELLWSLVPSQSRDLQRVRARHAFVVDKYVGSSGNGDTAEDASPMTKTTTTATTTTQRSGLREAEWRALEMNEEDAETTPADYQERLALLRRLNTALRKRDETLEPEAVEPSAPPLEQDQAVAIEREDDQEEHDLASPPMPEQLPQSLPPSPPRERPADAEIARPVELEREETVALPLPPTPVESYARTALAGATAIDVAAARERFDFAQDAGWQLAPLVTPPQGEHDKKERRGSFSRSLSKRFSLFRKRRASMDDAPYAPPTETTVGTSSPMPPSTTSPTTSSSLAPASRDAQRSARTKRTQHTKGPALRPHETSGSLLPVVQLSGLEAVHEAARRDQFDFSTDPWRASGDAMPP